MTAPSLNDATAVHTCGDTLERKAIMSFKHKLSRRLALLRNVLLVSVCAVVMACDIQKLLGLLVASVSVSPAAASVQVAGTVQLTAAISDATGAPLTGQVATWASNAPSVATVNSTGLVTGVAAGPATITASSQGHSGSAAITVTVGAPPPPPP